MTEIIFDEDRTILRALPKRDVAPEKGFEAWFHRHSPYSLNTNRAILFSVACIFFILSFVFLFAAYYNQNQKEEQRQADFQNRIERTIAR